MKTKFTLFLILLSLMLGPLYGCDSNATPTGSTNNSLSTASNLALGTLKLEGSTNAVTAGEAALLLTLWEGYESISNSDTTSQVERDALVKQIEATMTEAQVKAIESMNLTVQSVNEVLSTINSSNPSSTPDASVSSQTNSSGGSSGMPSGSAGTMPSGSSSGMPSGGPGGMASDGDGSGMGDVLSGVTAQSTPAASQSSAGTGSVQVSPILLRAVIQLLETRSQASG